MHPIRSCPRAPKSATSTALATVNPTITHDPLLQRLQQGFHGRIRELSTLKD